MSVAELDSLIVKNLADLEGAARRLTQIEDLVFKEMDVAGSDWIRNKGWDGEFDLNSGNCWLAPSDWKGAAEGKQKGPGAGKYDAYFEFDTGAGDTGIGKPPEDQFYLTRLCQVGSGTYGFRFWQNLLRPAARKRLMREHATIAEGTAFTLDEDTNFFMPFRIDCDELAKALREGALENALVPFSEALDRLGNARPEFDKIVHQIRAMSAAEA